TTLRAELRLPRPSMTCMRPRRTLTAGKTSGAQPIRQPHNSYFSCMNYQRVIPAYALLLAVLFCTPAFATQVLPDTTIIQNSVARREIDLDGRWNYIIDPYETGFYDYRRKPYDESPTGKGGFYDDRQQKDKGELIEYDFDRSPTLKVPGDWNSQDNKLLFYEGTIWYRRKFSVSPRAGRRYFLCFGAVNYEAHVYLNGKKLGMHKGGFTPFQFEVTGRLADGENTVVVKADNSRHPDEIPTVNTDWWNYGGITRDVWIASAPETFVCDYQLQLAKNDPGVIAGYVQLSGGAVGGQEVEIAIPEAGIRTRVMTGAEGRASISISV